MAQAIITRRDERFVGIEIDRPIIVPGFKANSRFGTPRLAYNTDIYPCGSATALTTRDGYLYICSTRRNKTSTTNTTSYEVHIGDKVYTKSTGTEDSYGASTASNCLVEVFLVPAGVTVSVKFTTTGTRTDAFIAVACTAV